jgi:hypothetical protein
MILRVILIAISFLLLAAHFLRYWHPLLMILCMASPFLLLIKKRWVLIVLQTLAYLGALVWIRTALEIVRFRMLHGFPYTRVILILGTVTLFTILSGLLLNSKQMLDTYP